MFCFHYSGGGASVFRDWYLFLPEFVEVCCIQLPGRETRFGEPLEIELTSVVNKLTSIISNHTDIPYVFFGHSVGALIGHHVLISLIQQGFPSSVHFIASGRSPPKDENRYYEKISHLPDPEFLQKIKEYNGTPQEVITNEELMSVFLPILKADFLLSESSIEVKDKMPCPITVFGGNEDRMPEAMLNLWKYETKETCDVHMFPGGHFFIVEQKQSVLRNIKDLLESVRADMK